MHDFLRLDRQLCFALYTATRAMTQAYAELLAPLGLTYPQYLVMLALWEADDVPLGQLGERLCLDSGTLTPLCKRLEAAGLVARVRDAADERVVRIRLTRAGRALEKKATAVPPAMYAKAALPVADFLRLREELAKLTATLRGASATSPPPAASETSP